MWEGIKSRVIPEIVEKKNIIRVWCAACSTGEEAYSIAMLFQEYKNVVDTDFEVKISKSKLL